MNSGDGEVDAEGTSDDVMTKISEGTAQLLNIVGKATDDGEEADDGTLAAGGAKAGVKLIV